VKSGGHAVAVHVRTAARRQIRARICRMKMQSSAERHLAHPRRAQPVGRLRARSLGSRACCITRRFVPSAVLRSSADAVGNYLQTLGTIYAVLLGVRRLHGHGNSSTTRARTSLREAHELLDLTRTVRGLPGRARAALPGRREQLRGRWCWSKSGRSWVAWQSASL
jgi:hypothetical protein